MKILISADMEGATGVTWPADVLPGTPQWERCRPMFTSDVERGGARVLRRRRRRGAGQRGALDDAQSAPGAARRPRRRCSPAGTRRFSMVEGVQHGDVDGIAFVGYHTGAGTEGRARAHLPRQLHHRASGSTACAPARACSTPWSSPSTGCRWCWSPATTSPARTRRATRRRRRGSPSRTTSRGTRRSAAPRPVPPPTSGPRREEAAALAVRHEPVAAAGRSRWSWSSTPSIWRGRPPWCRAWSARGRAARGVHRAGPCTRAIRTFKAVTTIVSAAVEEQYG